MMYKLVWQEFIGPCQTMGLTDCWASATAKEDLCWTEVTDSELQRRAQWFMTFAVG